MDDGPHAPDQATQARGILERSGHAVDPGGKPAVVRVGPDERPDPPSRRDEPRRDGAADEAGGARQGDDVCHEAGAPRSWRLRN